MRRIEHQFQIMLVGDIHSHGNMSAYASGTDEADEKQMLEEFVVPIVVGTTAGRR